MSAAFMQDFERIAAEAMELVWNRTPLPFQSKVISHVISMRCNLKNPEYALLV